MNGPELAACWQPCTRWIGARTVSSASHERQDSNGCSIAAYGGLNAARECGTRVQREHGSTCMRVLSSKSGSRPSISSSTHGQRSDQLTLQRRCNAGIGFEVLYLQACASRPRVRREEPWLAASRATLSATKHQRRQSKASAAAKTRAMQQILHPVAVRIQNVPRSRHIYVHTCV